MKHICAALLACSCAVALPAGAQERAYCPARPGLGTPACTISPGRVSVEIGIADWQRDNTPDERSDGFVLADTLIRIGVTDTAEVLAGWTPFGRLRSREKATGVVSRADGIGDAFFGFKANLAQPDGTGFSIAVQPFVTFPLARAPFGAGDWGSGVVLPMSYDLGDTLNLQLTGEVDAAPDSDGSGRHLAYSGTLGLGVAASGAVGTTIEVQGSRDRDPDGRSTQWVGALSLGWTPSDDLQLDVGANVGLNRDAPDAEIYFGASRQF